MRINNNNAKSQQQRLLLRLRQGPVNTITARHELNILAPAARVYELRWNYGLNIITNIRVEYSPEGFSHDVAEYVLLPGQWQGGAANE